MARPRKPYLVLCCDRFAKAIREENVMSLDCFPDRYVPEIAPESAKEEVKWEWQVVLISDGGHGGLEEISNCPFCGTRISMSQRKT